MNEQLRDQAIEYIRINRHVTFVELENICTKNGVNPRGPFSWEVLPNLVIWSDMSEEFCDLIESIRPVTQIDSANVFVYLADGGMLKLPIAKRPPKKGYKEPHWAPVTISLKPEKQGRVVVELEGE